MLDYSGYRLLSTSLLNAWTTSLWALAIELNLALDQCVIGYVLTLTLDLKDMRVMRVLRGDESAEGR
jgi:hypothetical protein